MNQSPLPMGQYDRSVTIEQRIGDGRASSGYPAGEWTTLGTEFMARQDFGGQASSRRERFVANQDMAIAESRWEVRYRADMDPELIDVPKLRRLVHSGRTYNITSARVLGWKAGIELLTQAAVG